MSAPGVQTSGHHSWCKIVDVYVTQLSLSTGYACNLKLCDAIFSGVWFFILQWQSIIVMKCPGMTYVLPVSNIVWSATCGIVLCTVAVQVKLAANVEQHTVFSVLAYLRLKHDGSILLFSSAIPHYVSLSVHCRLGIVENSQVPHVETSVVQSTFVCLNLSRFKTADFFYYCITLFNYKDIICCALLFCTQNEVKHTYSRSRDLVGSSQLLQAVAYVHSSGVLK